MTDTTCAACGSSQAAGAAWCAVCGTAFPRTGAPAPAAGGPPVPVGPVPAGPVPAVAAPVYTGTTEPERIAATVRGFSAPAPAPAPAPELAGTGRRFAAYVLDAFAVAIVPVVVALVGISSAGIPLDGTVVAVTQAEADEILGTLARTYVLAGVLALAGWVALVVVEGRTGRTPAGLLLGLRTVDAQTLAPIGAGRSFLRWLIVGASGLALAVGQLLMLLSPAFDASGRRQGWHDKAVRSVVLRQRGRQATAPADATFAAPTRGATPQAAPAPSPSAAPPSTPALSAPAPSTPPPSPAVPDPWAFPSPAPTAPAPSGLITGVPGRPDGLSAPAPAPAPVLTPAPGPGPAPASAPAPAPTPPAPSYLAEIDGETRMAPARQQVLVLELATGERHPVTARTLVGRNPQAPAGEPWDVVTVPDPTRSVSKTHAELHPDLGGLWVVDRGSTNGTVVSVPGRAPQVAAPGSRVRITAGATLHVGDARIVVHPEAS